MRISTRRLAVAVVAAAIVAAPSAASAAAPSPSDPAGHIGGVIPVHGDAKTARPSGGSNLSYHGGPVMTTDTLYTIYWLPASAPSGVTMSSGYQSTVDGFFTDVAAVPGSSTKDVYAINTQYSGIQNAEAVGGSWLDTSALPANGCSDSVTKAYCLSDAQIQKEITSDVAAAGWAPSATSLFVMLTPKRVGSCYSSTSCAFTQYCAYHGDYSSGTKTYYYANMPYSATDPAACGTGEDPSGDADAASEINILSHEQNEAITDEALNAWYDRQGNEIGDKCAWNFGSYSGSSGKEYNQVINGHEYFLQQEWSNKTSSCALHM